MRNTFKLNGIKYIKWTKDGIEFNAPLMQVRMLGKEFFEELGFEEMFMLDTQADGISFNPTDFDVQEAIQSKFEYLREQEIM